MDAQENDSQCPLIICCHHVIYVMQHFAKSPRQTDRDFVINDRTVVLLPFAAISFRTRSVTLMNFQTALRKVLVKDSGGPSSP